MNGAAFLQCYVYKVVVLSFVVSNLCAHYTIRANKGSAIKKMMALCVCVWLCGGCLKCLLSLFYIYSSLFTAKLVLE